MINLMNNINDISKEILLFSGVTTSLIQIIKMAIEDYIPSKFFPLLSVILGFVLGFIAGLPWMASLMIGLAASGAYDFTKNTALGIKEQIDKNK